MALLRELRSRDGRVTVLTNSPAPGDEPLVHAGCRQYREELLREGVGGYELSSSRLRDDKPPFLFSKRSVGRMPGWR